ncbi:MAG TPA: ATP-binding protein [Thermoanaerobaculia bacterium]
MPHNEGLDPARREFLKRFFHDLATPLSAVSLHLEGADRRARRGGDPSEALAVARTELGKAFDLFDRGREFLLEAPGKPQTLELDSAVRSVASEYAGVRLEGETGARIHGNPGALKTAVSALIANAVEAAGAEAVRVRLGRENSTLRVEVENPGQLPTDNAEALFSPKTARPGRNWGMGLPLARVGASDLGGVLRIEQLEGTVRATLEIPEGSR